MKRQRKLKPSTVMKKWNALCLQIKNDKTKRKAPGKKLAKQYAAMAGMKSIGEVRCAADLDQRKIPWEYEAETLTYQHQPQKYTPDFLLQDGTLIEYKGKMTNEVRKKLLSIKRCNPKRRLCIVFEKPDNKLSSRPNATRYWQWAERNGFEWSDQVVNQEWLD